jgi:Putative beta-barrel porin 2
MKKIVASVGLVAVGVTGLQADVFPGLTAESGKPWTASATLRGFYDDNPSTQPNSSHPQGSSGFEISPAIEFLFPWEQTTLSFGYIYSLKYYEQQLVGTSGHDDNTQDAHFALTHAFSERYSISVSDSFVIGQEPDFLRAGNTFTTFQRYSGNNMRNYGAIDFAAQLNPEFGLDLGYANTLVNYSDNADPTVTGVASNAGLLNEMDNVVHLDGRYQLQPQTVGILGVQYRQTDFTGGQPIGVYDNGQPVMSDARNARSYYGYVGVDQNFRPDLTGSIRLGGRYTDYYNSLDSQNQGSPYAMASLKYTYLPESSLEIGGSYDYSPTSLSPSPNTANQINTSAEAGTVFVALNHRIVPKLFGSVLAQYQNSMYVGGVEDGKADNFYLVGLNLRYQFNPNFSAGVGYNYDNLTGVQPHYDRNRVYIGITGSY